jgi:hypothetical protein
MRFVSIVGLALALAASAFADPAGSVICAAVSGPGALPGWSSCPSYVSTAPFTPPFTVTDYLDWGAPNVIGGVFNPVKGESGFGDQIVGNDPQQPIYGQTNTGNGVTVALNQVYSGNYNDLYRADNTIYAWSTSISGWTAPGSNGVPNTDTFAGHFGAPSTPSSTPAYGDRLLGTILGSGGAIVISFTQPVYDVAFRVSSGSSSGTSVDANFIGTMVAYSGTGGTGSVLGSSAVDATGLGGTCTGLQSLSPNPVPCNDAPLLEIGNDGAISSIEVSSNSANGIWLDTLQLDDGNPSPVPEPGVLFLMGGGLGLVIVSRLRKNRASR